MYRLAGAIQHYYWGSSNVIPDFLGASPDGRPWAELWFGTHPLGITRTNSGSTLAELIANNPQQLLGEDVTGRFGPDLPFLMKIIAPEQPLSLQVHPDLMRAGERFEWEEKQGIVLDAPERNYKDSNHKPEMLYALTDYEALSGFRPPRQILEILTGLDSHLAKTLRRTLRLNPTRFGTRQAFSEIVSGETRPNETQLAELVEDIRRRYRSHASPYPDADRVALQLAEKYPGDPGVAAALLLNYVKLTPGEALFIPAGAVHAYLCGLGVEVMATSDNVLRAGLTKKHVDVEEMLACVDYVAAPAFRPAAEYLSRATRAFRVPVDDFELLCVTLVKQDGRVQIPGRGPRIVLAVDGEVELSSPSGSETLCRGQAVFVGADERTLAVEGEGMVVQTDVP